MDAIISSEIESSFQNTLEVFLKQKYDEVNIIISAKPPAFICNDSTVFVAINSTSKTSDILLNQIQSSAPNLEFLIVLTPPEMIQKQKNALTVSSEVIAKTEKGIEDFFYSNGLKDFIVNSRIQSPKETANVSIEEDDFPMNEDNEEFPMSEGDDDFPSIDTDNDFPMSEGDDDFPSIEADNDFPMTEGDGEFPSIEADNDFPMTEGNDDFPSIEADNDFPMTEGDDDFPSNDTDNDLPINGGKDNSTDSSVIIGGDKLETSLKEENSHILNNDDYSKENNTSSEQVQKRNLKSIEFENKVINLREAVNIPVWNKKRISPKTIAVWSPLQRIGVTTFTINFALYLASLQLPVAVLEGITNNCKLKTQLEVYSNGKKGWRPYAHYLFSSGVAASNTLWNYQDVQFFPFEYSKDMSWSAETIRSFINGVKFHDVVFVDLPTGEMAPYTLEALNYVDELWIIANNDVLSIIEWKEYIQKNVGSYVDSINIIFVDNYAGLSIPSAVSSKLGFPLLTAIPSIQEDVVKSYFNKCALIEQEEVLSKIEPSFVHVLNHLLDNKIPKSLLTTNVGDSETFITKLTKKLLKR